MNNRARLTEWLVGKGAVLQPSEANLLQVQSFGDPIAEQQAAEKEAVWIALPALVRIVVEGQDRARYLHNFCTNDVKKLVNGQVCEAFFVDVKARILAHGWILARETCHEIWMLPGDEQGLLRHLNKYIITEDVLISSMTDSTVGFAVCGNRKTVVFSAGLQADGSFQSHTSGTWNYLRESCGDGESGDRFSPGSIVVHLGWGGNHVDLLSFNSEDVDRMISRMEEFPVQWAGMSVFEMARLRERLPIIGRDMSIDHLAPEADRNSVAISYVKGCYLGQEPIARLDAMGHINRGLRVFSSDCAKLDLTGAAIVNASGTELGSVSSFASSASSMECLMMGMVRLAGLKGSHELLAVKDGLSIPIRLEDV